MRAGRAAATTAALALVVARAATAQFSADLALVSDYRYRGVSLSDDRPALQAGFGYDARNGLYAGAFASTLDAPFIASHALAQLYAGFARRVGAWTWDAGASLIAFPGAREYDFAELHVGTTVDRWNIALHYSPDYFGRDVRSFYGEVNGAWPLPEALVPHASLVAHAGLLHAEVPEYVPVPTRSRRFDAKAGIAFDAGWAKLEVAWVTGDTPLAVYPVRRDSSRHAVVFSIARAF